MTGDIARHLIAADLQQRRDDLLPRRARVLKRPDEQVPEMTENDRYQQCVLDWEMRQG